MNAQGVGWRAPCAVWWLRRNPLYLISALLMAYGAKVYLDVPMPRAGDVKLILVTLGVLQVYEWAVTGVLLWLHRSRRSPEDQPSLLLVATLFWTGPLAATAEMTGRGAASGVACAIGASLIALGELAAVRRALRLNLSRIGCGAAGACVLLLALSPPWLKVPAGADGTNEIFHYLAWWTLAAVALLVLPAMRTHAPRGAFPAEPGAAGRALRTETAFLALTVGATTLHLWAMNYAYFANVRAFYAVPLIAVAAALATEYLAIDRRRSRWWLVVAAALPAFGIYVSYDARFALGVPADAFPRFVRDPLLVALALAAFAWWFGYVRHGRLALFHLGSAAFAGAAWRAVPLFSPTPIDAAAVPTETFAPEMMRWLVVFAAYGLAGYLLLVAYLRWSRSEAVVGLIAQLVGTVAVVWRQTDADGLIIGAAAGWTWLLGTYIVRGRAAWPAILGPVVLLGVVAWAHDFDSLVVREARMHAAITVVVLLAVGFAQRWTRLWAAGWGLGTAHGGFYLARWVGSGPYPVATFAILGAFLLLAVGAIVSRYKPELLDWAQTILRPDEPIEGEDGPGGVLLPTPPAPPEPPTDAVPPFVLRTDL